MFEFFLPPGRAEERRDAQNLACVFEVVGDMLQEKLETSPEEWERFRTRFFGSLNDRHGTDDLRVSLCFYESWTSMCNALSSLPFDQVGEMADSLMTRAAVLRDRARLRISWRRATKQHLRKVV